MLNSRRIHVEPSDAAKAFVGQVLRLRIKEVVDPDFGTVRRYEIADRKKKSQMLALGKRVRIFLPGDCGTMNVDVFRLNFSVDESGLITHTYMG